MKHLWLSAALALSAVALAACGGDGNGNTASTTPPTTTPPVSIVDRFGSGFASSFRVSMDAEPRAVASGDLDPLNANTEPQQLQ